MSAATGAAPGGGAAAPTGAEASAETVHGVDEGRRRHYGTFYGLDPVPSSDRPLLAVLGNCQAEALRITSTTTSGPSPFDSVRVPPVHELTPDDLPHLQRLLPRLDVLAAQPVRAGYRGLPLGTEEIAPLLHEGARLVVIPVLRDPSAYPYQALVRGEAGDPPVVPYHDLRTLAAVAGLSGGPGTLTAAQRADAYRQVAAEGVAELARRREASKTLAADDLTAAHLGEGWTINHPGNAVLMGVGARIREACDLAAPGADPGRVLLRSIRTPLEQEVVDALDLPYDARADWLVGEEVVPDADVVAAQTRWYAEHPEMVTAGVERHAARLRLLGWAA